MKGKVNDGDLVTLAPCDASSLSVNDIVLVRVHGNDYLHLIKAMDAERFQIGNNRGGINGWVQRAAFMASLSKWNPTLPKRAKKGAQSEATGQEK